MRSWSAILGAAAVTAACGVLDDGASRPAPNAIVPGWRLGAPMAQARFTHSVTRLQDGRVLVAGGFPTLSDAVDAPDHTDALATAELYDPSTGLWKPTGSMAGPRAWHAAVLLPDGKVLVAGGASRHLRGGDPMPLLASAELFDPETEVWEPTGEMSSTRLGGTNPSLACALLPDGTVLVAGGWNAQEGALAVSERYDPTTGTWSPTGPLDVRRSEPSLVLLADGRHVLAVGGVSTANTRPAEVYEIAEGTWHLTGALDAGAATIDYGMALLDDGRVLVAGGCLRRGYPCDEDTSDQYGRTYDPVTEEWTRTSLLSTRRQHGSAVVLPSRKVLLSGGASAGDLYDATLDTWTPTSDLPARESGLASSVLLPTGEVLHVGGMSNHNPVFAAIDAAQLYREP